jgi:hypothetical protein
LIYFIFRDDTYVIFLNFACLMIIGEFTTGVKILLEILTEVARGKGEVSHQGPTPPGGAGQP